MVVHCFTSQAAPDVMLNLFQVFVIIQVSPYVIHGSVPCPHYWPLLLNHFLRVENTIFQLIFSKKGFVLFCFFKLSLTTFQLISEGTLVNYFIYLILIYLILYFALVFPDTLRPFLLFLSPHANSTLALS